MAFRKIIFHERRVPLVSLIDLIFILLIFFVVTSIMTPLNKEEARLYLPTPKNEPGEAQILIQILDGDRYLWMDHTAIDTLNRYSYLFKNSDAPANKVDLLLSKMTLNAEGLFERLAKLKEALAMLERKEYFILIRCPEQFPYFYATNIMEKLAGNPYLEYGCVAGAIEDLRSSRNFVVQGNILQIDF
jgi:biopolymer transport protein ExbD